MTRWLLVIVLLLLPVLPTAQAQGPQDEVIAITGQLAVGSMLVGRGPVGPPDPTARFDFTFQDISVNSIHSALGGAEPHNVVARIEWEDGGDAPEGWGDNPVTPNFFQTQAGMVQTGYFEVTHAPSTPVPEVRGFLVLTIVGQTTQKNDTIRLPWVITIAPQPAAAMEILPGTPSTVGPYETVVIRIRITNRDVYPASYNLSAVVQPAEGIDPATLGLSGLGDYYIQPGDTITVAVQFVTPRDLFWYWAVPLIITFSVRPSEGGGEQQVPVIMTIDGFYVSENLVLLILLLLAQLFVLIFFLVYARRVYERRYLGRPIPPWEIPEERANLERLKREDPRGHYVLRYFLMEEEYRSALLWFDAYKKVSKKQLKAEARAADYQEKAAELVAEQPTDGLDKRRERLQRRYARRIERVRAWETRSMASLQAKLERNYEKDFGKDHAKWETAVKKHTKKQRADFVRQHKAWERETQKILAKWEAPFKRKRAKYGKTLAEARARYEQRVKKLDRSTWKAWKEQHDDWLEEMKIRRKEHRPAVPEPELSSAKVGAPELPPPFPEPPKPELPVEPKDVEVTGLPAEPQVTVPTLATSHYAKKAQKVATKASRNVRKLELDLAAKLLKVHDKGRERIHQLETRRGKLSAAASEVAKPGLMDRVLRRTPEQLERKHQRAYLRGRSKERIKEMRETELGRVERIRIEGDHEAAEKEAEIIRAKATQAKAKRMGEAAEPERVEALERELRDLQVRNRTRLEEAAKAAKERIARRTVELKAQEKEDLEKLDGASRAPASDVTPTES